jgi:antitoxin component YwqK of YwqJK toxin-antitoxin module
MSGADSFDEDLEPYEHFHADGSIFARGNRLEGQDHGCWEWFRREGTLMRTGSFERGVQVGEWTTYDPNGIVVKVTRVRKPGEKPR